MTSLEHSHGGHVHRHANNERRLITAASLTAAFLLIEAAGGSSGSLVLLADAGHMLADVASLGLAGNVFRLSRQPADSHRTDGFERMQVLVAFANGLALFAIAIWIVIEAARRLLAPTPVEGTLMFWVAALGLVLNASMNLRPGCADRDNLNVRGAMVHVIGDLLGALGVFSAAALVILLTGWTPADPIISVVVALIILRSAGRVVADFRRTCSWRALRSDLR